MAARAVRNESKFGKNRSVAGLINEAGIQRDGSKAGFRFRKPASAFGFKASTTAISIMRVFDRPLAGLAVGILL